MVPLWELSLLYIMTCEINKQSKNSYVQYSSFVFTYQSNILYKQQNLLFSALSTARVIQLLSDCKWCMFNSVVTTATSSIISTRSTMNSECQCKISCKRSSWWRKLMSKQERYFVHCAHYFLTCEHINCKTMSKVRNSEDVGHHKNNQFVLPD